MQDFFCEMEVHTWKSLRNVIEPIRQDFAEIIDGLNPSNAHKMYVIKYPYGALPLEKGIFQLPNPKGLLVPISHSSLSNKIKDELGYTGSIPLGLVTMKGFESFVQSNSRILSSAFISKGSFLSLWRVFEQDSSFYLGPFWNYASGSRSICMLPKITDTACHKNLKTKYGLKLPVPQQLSDHPELFKCIANHPNFPQPWSSEVVFFSKQWFEHKKDKCWDGFYRFLLDEVWKVSFFRRNAFIFEIAFSVAIENGNLKPNPYLAATAKHLIALASGASLSFTLANDDTAAPITGLQKTYIEDYGLKKYAPTILHSYHFSPKINRPAYYSFQIPNTTVFLPKSRKLSTKMSEILELKLILEKFTSEILKGNLGVKQTPLYDIAKNIRFGYYHSDKDKSGEILPANEISQIDSRFTKTLIDNNDYIFPEFAPFFKGCIAISNTQS